MADKKISQLTGASTPLAGSEVLPIVQSGSTVKVSVDNLTAGKSVSATSFVPTGSTVPANGMFLPNTNTLALSTGTTERARVTSTGQVLVGSTAAQGKWYNLTTYTPTFQVEKSFTSGLTAAQYLRAGFITNSNDSNGTFVGFAKSRGTTDGSTTALQLNDSICGLSFQGADGSEFVPAADIQAAVDGTPAANDMPGRLVFRTTASGAATPTERMRISSAGNVSIANGNLVVSTAAKGIDFSANTHAAGMTSELLNWYEEGTWTPTDASGAGLTFAQANGSYTRIGRQVTAWGFVTYPGTASANGVEIGGLPFTSANVDAVRGGGMIGFCDASTVSSVLTNKNGTAVKLYDSSGVQIVNSTMNNKSIYYAVTYFV